MLFDVLWKVYVVYQNNPLNQTDVYVAAWLMTVGRCQTPQGAQGSEGAQGSPGGQGEGKQLIMLEIERLNYPDEDKVVKRQAEVRYGGAGQYVVQTRDQAGAPQQVFVTSFRKEYD